MPVTIERDCHCCQYATKKINELINKSADIGKVWDESGEEFEREFWHEESCWNKFHKSGWINGKSDFISREEKFGEKK